MQYKCEGCKTTELLWNSRDGVAPFVIKCPTCGSESTHIDFGSDLFSKDYIPLNDSRVFVDLTLEKYRKNKRKYINKYWNNGIYPISKRWNTREDALDALTKDYHNGMPDIMTGKEYHMMEELSKAMSVIPGPKLYQEYLQLVREDFVKFNDFKKDNIKHIDIAIGFEGMEKRYTLDEFLEKLGFNDR